jgi:outer membrane protein assembly factor BamB
MSFIRSLGALLLCVGISSAADWPQWLGPTRDGVSTETVSPWKEAPRALWKHPAGEGHSSPVVAGGRVFFHAKVQDKNEEEVVALDAATGKVLWQVAYPRASFSSVFGNGPRATPAVHGDKVYTFGVTGVLSCFEAATGKLVWQFDTLKKFAAKNLFFGTSCSPLIDSNRLFLNVGARGASIVAFDKDKGDVLWKSLDDPASYSSPIIFGTGTTRQMVFFTQQGLVSLNPEDGAVFWKYPLVDLLSESSTTPVRSSDVLIASTITYGSVGVRLETKADKPATELIWKNPDLTCYFSTPVAADKDHLFVVTGTKPPALQVQANLQCIETRTGKVLWQRPRVGKYHATLLRTGNNKLLLLDDGGHLTLLEPNTREYQELARSRVCGETWAHPALADGRLYVRDNKELICLQLGN